MKIKEYKTCELVEELSKREGVERIDVSLEEESTVTVRKNDEEIYDSTEDGGEIILRIID